MNRKPNKIRNVLTLIAIIILLLLMTFFALRQSRSYMDMYENYQEETSAEAE